jgi:hypothetical protein
MSIDRIIRANAKGQISRNASEASKSGPPKSSQPLQLDGLELLAQQAWQLYRSCEAEFIVEPSMPILFFGNSSKYQTSPRRIITVGKNPSHKEFPPDDPFQRFRGGDDLIVEYFSAHGAGDFFQRYLATLDRYFERHSIGNCSAYSSWFGSFEALLGGVGCSFYSGGKNVSLHTDLFSPLATKPTWSKLQPTQRALLEPDGKALWHRLVQELSPHIVLVSLSEEHRSRIPFGSPHKWTRITHHFEYQKVQMGTQDMTFVSGPPPRRGTPFMGLTYAQLSAAGAEIGKATLD